MFYVRKAALAVASLAIVAGFSNAASACSSGFLADMACRAGIINQQTAQGLDQAHAAMGRPLDHLANQAAGAAANYVVPGSGPFVTNGLEMRDQFNRSGGFNGMGGVPGGFAPQLLPYQPAPTAMGMFCQTYSGRYAGPMNPVGAPCTAVTPWGLQAGQVQG